MLDLYRNIKRRRLELHMSQQQLAELTGYSSKSMIAHIESGNVDLSISKIELFAKVLKMDPGDLLGPTPSSVPQLSGLTSSEIRIVKKLLKLDDQDQLKVEGMIDSYLMDLKYQDKERLA